MKGEIALSPAFPNERRTMDGALVTASVAVIGVVFTSGILYQKVNGNSKRVDILEGNNKKHLEKITRIDERTEGIEKDITEVKCDMKKLLKVNGKK